MLGKARKVRNKALQYGKFKESTVNEGGDYFGLEKVIKWQLPSSLSWYQHVFNFPVTYRPESDPILLCVKLNINM